MGRILTEVREHPEGFDSEEVAKARSEGLEEPLQFRYGIAGWAAVLSNAKLDWIPSLRLNGDSKASDIITKERPFVPEIGGLPYIRQPITDYAQQLLGLSDLQALLLFYRDNTVTELEFLSEAYAKGTPLSTVVTKWLRRTGNGNIRYRRIGYLRSWYEKRSHNYSYREEVQQLWAVLSR